VRIASPRGGGAAAAGVAVSAGNLLRTRSDVVVALTHLRREMGTNREEILRDVIATVKAHGRDKGVKAIPAPEVNSAANHRQGRRVAGGW
jgi:hypothetical protein